VRCWSHRHTTSLAQEGGPTTGGTWTRNGKRRQAESLVGFVQALHLHSRRKRGGVPSPRTTCVPAFRDTRTILFVDGQHEPALGFPVGGGKLGPGREAAKRWEPPGKPPGGQTRHHRPASASKGDSKEPALGMRTCDSLLGKQGVTLSPLACRERALLAHKDNTFQM
jgi:hypothetical protein